MSTTDLSVGECLRQADQEVRSLTLDVEDVRADQLLAAWHPFLSVSARVLHGLGPTGTAGAAVVESEASRWAWRAPAGVEREPRLMAATGLLDRAGELIDRYASPTAPDRIPVASYVLGTVCVGAHVVARSARDHLEATRPVPGGRRRELHAGSVHGIDRSTISRLVERVQRVEDFALVAVQGAGRHTWPAEEPLSEERVHTALSTWMATTERCLRSGRASVDDLRWIAATNGQLEMHSLVLLAAAKDADVVNRGQIGGLPAVLRSAAQAWARAGEQWPAAMFGPDRRAGAELLAARHTLNQALQTVTRPEGNHWASPQQIARTQDPALLLDYLVDAHRGLSRIAQDYEHAADALVRSGQIMVPGARALEYTGRVSNAAWVAVPGAYADRMNLRDRRLPAAAEAARNGLDTATVMTAAAARARARLPPSMAGPDLDEAIRARVRRLTTLAGKLDRPTAARDARDPDARPHQAPRQQGPRAR